MYGLENIDPHPHVCSHTVVYIKRLYARLNKNNTMLRVVECCDLLSCHVNQNRLKVGVQGQQL